MTLALWLLAFLAGTAAIVWGAEAFAEHLGRASVRLGVSTFALALLLAGAEPEELATVIAASLRGSPGIALGDVVGANVTICLVALGVGAVIAPLPFRAAVMRYALLGPEEAMGRPAKGWHHRRRMQRMDKGEKMRSHGPGPEFWPVTGGLVRRCHQMK